jgi:hypothetical protein
MSSLVITVKSPRTQTTLNDRLRISSSRAPDAVANLAAYLHGCAGGLESASVSVQTGSADPIFAAQALTVVFASLNAADTVTIGGVVLTCTLGAPAASQFQKLTDGTVTAANLAAAINTQGSLSQFVSATSVGAIVTVTADVPGIIGNLVAVLSSAGGVTLGGATLVGGAGGANNAPISYSRGY